MQIININLFGEVHYEVLPDKSKAKAARKKKAQALNLHTIQTPLTITTDTLQSYPEYTGPAPTGLIGFNECSSCTDYTRTVHFYLHDYKFTRILRHPEKYVEQLSKFASIIAPDFSVWADMSYDDAMYSLAASRAVANYYYEHGIKVIPNVQWSVPILYDKCFADIPANSMVAINCTGIKQRDISKYLWRLGYNEALQRLNPACIIRYGDKMPGEDESRSIYFPNERLIRLRGGAYGG